MAEARGPRWPRRAWGDHGRAAGSTLVGCGVRSTTSGCCSWTRSTRSAAPITCRSFPGSAHTHGPPSIAWPRMPTPRPDQRLGQGATAACSSTGGTRRRCCRSSCSRSCAGGSRGRRRSPRSRRAFGRRRIPSCSSRCSRPCASGPDPRRRARHAGPQAREPVVQLERGQGRVGLPRRGSISPSAARSPPAPTIAAPSRSSPARRSGRRPRRWSSTPAFRGSARRHPPTCPATTSCARSAGDDCPAQPGERGDRGAGRGARRRAQAADRPAALNRAPKRTAHIGRRWGQFNRPQWGHCRRLHPPWGAAATDPNALAITSEAAASGRRGGAAAVRPQQARRGPSLRRSHSGESERVARPAFRAMGKPRTPHIGPLMWPLASHTSTRAVGTSSVNQPS
jgi:hypothetical protein